MDAVEYRRRGKMLAYQAHPVSAAFQEGRTAFVGVSLPNNGKSKYPFL